MSCCRGYKTRLLRCHVAEGIRPGCSDVMSRNGRAGSGPGGARVPKNGVLLKNGVLIVPHFCGENYFWPGFFADKNMCQGVPLPQKKMGYY